MSNKFSNWIKSIKNDNKESDKKMDNFLQKLAAGIMNHKKTILIVFAVLIVLSVIGSMFVQKESDVISYLDDDTVTIQGLTTLKDEYGIIGDFSMGISYLSEKQVSSIISIITNTYGDTGFKNSKYIKNIVWIETFDSLKDLPTYIISAENLASTQETLKNKFVIDTTLDDGSVVQTYIVSIYFTTANSSDETIATIDEIEELLTDTINGYVSDGTAYEGVTDPTAYYAFSGSASNSRSLLKSSIGDMPKFVIAAVVAVFIILMLTTSSYLEPIIFLATLGISILLNMGTNIIAGNPIGKISSITSSCATILQLAVSMDYAIFVMHTYYEELRTTPNPKLALQQALPKTIKSVVASALTTVGSFIALFFMDFGIGYDLGFVLAKGVLLSLITVICLQPIFILLLNKPIAKTHHNWNITPRLKFVSKIITKKGVAIPIIAACILLMIPAAMFQSKVDLTFITVQAENENPNVAETAMASSSNMLIVMVPYTYSEYSGQYDFIEKAYKVGYSKESTFDENTTYYTPDSTGKMSEITLTNETFVADTYYVKDGSANTITDIFSLCTILDENALETIDGSSALQNIVYSKLHKSFISNAYIYYEDSNGITRSKVDTSTDSSHYMLYTMTINGGKEDELSYNTLNKIDAISTKIFGENSIQMTGNVVAASELSVVTPKDYMLVNILSVLIIFLILLFTFKSPLLSVILVFVIETGIWINLSVCYFMGVQLHFMAYLIVSAIALGATVDYAILVTSKYLEEKANGSTGQAAIRNAIYRAAPGVLTSGSIFFFACLAVQLLSTNIIVKQITELLARNAIFSVVLVFTFLPAILSIKERIYKAWCIKHGKGDPDEGKTSESIYSVSSKKLDKYKKEHQTATEAVSNSDVIIDQPVIIDEIKTVDDNENK